MSSSSSSSEGILSGDELYDVCSQCGNNLTEQVFYFQLDANTVIRRSCPRCFPRSVDLLSQDMSQQNRENEGAEEQSSEMIQEISTNRQTYNRSAFQSPVPETPNYPKQLPLDANNIGKVDVGDQMTLNINGRSDLFTVRHHSAPQKEIEVRKHGEARQCFSYGQILARGGTLIFNDDQDIEDWNNRPKLPSFVHYSETLNYKAFMRMIRLEYFEKVRVFKETPAKFKKFISRAVVYGTKLLQKAYQGVSDKVFAPVQQFFLNTWDSFISLFRGNEKPKVDEGAKILDQGKGEVEMKTKRSGGIEIRDVAAGAIGAGVFGSMATGAAVTFKIVNLVACVEAAALQYPAVATAVSLAGGPVTFLAIGGLALIVGGGLAGIAVYRLSTLNIRKAQED